MIFGRKCSHMMCSQKATNVVDVHSEHQGKYPVIGSTYVLNVNLCEHHFQLVGKHPKMKVQGA